jgi:hypothetical protein
LNIVPVSRQKGLEFDDVILVEPQDIINIEEIGLRQLYVAVTRSLRGLSIYSTGELPTQLLEESSDLDALIQEYGYPTEDPDLASEFNEIKRDIEGFLRIKGLTLKEFVSKVRKSDSE